ncbi:hypothetical protein GCM10011357_08950 [Lacimicrobium alkaliphilum]|uniref:SPOR domain-containing protein n=1 Tax=Lacimicrobium alkaliphilum TaxID=1526571 RepID=A0ABQ1R5E6_9ALTE|nr:hypothetical protein GCM10011357_08950 [Lacimicrobium alkaliphilum]
MLFVLLTTLFSAVASSQDTSAATLSEIKKTLSVIKRKYAGRRQSDIENTKPENVSAPDKMMQTPPEAASTDATAVTPKLTDAPVLNTNADDIAMSESSPDVVISPSEVPETAIGSRFAEGEELILSLSLGDIYLADMFAFKSRRGLKVGLIEFSELMEFPIEVDLDPVSAQGWFLSTDNQFSLKKGDAEQLLVDIAGQKATVAEDAYFIDDDIYLELTDLADWFEFAIALNEAQLTLTLTPSTPFPIQQRMARRGNEVYRSGTTPSVLPPIDSGYQLYSSPLLDVQASVQTDEDDTSSSYSLLSSQDMAYFNSQLFLAGNDRNGLNNARLTFSRQSAQADLLGALQMTEFAFGDVVPVNVGAGQTKGLSRGFSMNNATRGLVDNQRVNLTGEVQAGWDVELHRNGVLIDRRLSVDDGRYAFNDIELSFGENNFELILYGPQGQVETRQESYFIDSNTVSQGEGLLQFSLVDANRSLLGVSEDTQDLTQRGVDASAVYDYGVSDWLSVGVGSSFFEPELGDTQQQYSLRTNVVVGDIGLYNATYKLDKDNRANFSQNFRTRIGQTSWSLGYRHNEILDEERRDTGSGDTEVITLRMTGRLFHDLAFPLSYENRYQQVQFENGKKTEQIQNILGINSRYGSVTNALIMQRGEGTGDQEENTSDEDWDLGGSLSYKNRFGKAFTRFFMNYRIEPFSELSSVGSAVTFPITSYLKSEFRYSHSLQTDEDQYDLRLNWLGDTFTLSGLLNYDTGNDWSVSLNARMSLGYESELGRFFASGRSLSQSGSLSVRVYEDSNLDKQYTQGEPVLDDVEVEAVQAYRRERTDASGVAVLKALPNHRRTDIVIDKASLPDFTLTPVDPGFSVNGRKGLIQHVDIAVVRAGELDGVIYLKDEQGVESPAPRMRINLVNMQGDVVASTRSEFDGYYLFDSIMPGDYQLQIDSALLSRRSLRQKTKKQLIVSNRGDLITGVDFVLSPLKKARGFVVNAGEFRSVGLLKLYYQLLQKRLGKSMLQDAFYIRPTDMQSYVIGLGYYEDSENAEVLAEEQCQMFSQSEVKCSVDYFEFEY